MPFPSSRLSQRWIVLSPIRTVLLTYTLLTGDRIIVVVQRHRTLTEGGPGTAATAGASSVSKVRRGDLRHAVVVRAHQKRHRKDGMVVGFDDNACVLISKAGEPIGTRVTSKTIPLSRMHELWNGTHDV